MPTKKHQDDDVCSACENTWKWHQKHRPRHIFKKVRVSKASFAQNERRKAAKHKIVRLLEEAGWTVGRNDGEFVVTQVDLSEEADADVEVHVRFNLNDLSIEQELRHMNAGTKPTPQVSSYRDPACARGHVPDDCDCK